MERLRLEAEIFGDIKDETGRETLDQLIAAADEAFFSMLKFSEYRELQALKDALSARNALASARNDVKFFVRLGRAFEEKPRELSEIQHDKDSLFLIQNWAATKWPGVPGLAYFSDEALYGFCTLYFSHKHRENGWIALRKKRQRLGLEKAANPLITKVEKKGKRIILS